ncbi:unnamed protein product, partial [Ectocarpus sp. 12 AP-2014]
SGWQNPLQGWRSGPGMMSRRSAVGGRLRELSRSGGGVLCGGAGNTTLGNDRIGGKTIATETVVYKSTNGGECDRCVAILSRGYGIVRRTRSDRTKPQLGVAR